jgi:nicotinate-nucleotide adenylyltransferase
MSDERPRLGILGGSFNPPHLGHLLIASDVCAYLDLEKVLFVPAARPPHKTLDDGTPADVRLEMTRLAVAGDPRFDVSPVEIEHDLVYTLDTVAAIRQQYDGYRLYFIMGSDSLLQFETWHQPGAILALCRLAVALRPGDDEREVEEVARGLGRGFAIVLKTAMIDVSSHEIRNRVRRDEPIRYLVPPAVEEFVAARRLYKVT